MLTQTINDYCDVCGSKSDQRYKDDERQTWCCKNCLSVGAKRHHDIGVISYKDSYEGMYDLFQLELKTTAKLHRRIELLEAKLEGKK